MSEEFELHKKLFTDYLRVEKSLSENTISAYRSDLEKFFSYAEDAKLISLLRNISEETVTDFLNYLGSTLSKSEKNIQENRYQELFHLLNHFSNFWKPEISPL